MTYTLSTDWVKRVDQSRQAILDDDGKFVKRVGVIEPDFQFTSRTIGIFANSQSVNPNWYRAGVCFQAFLVGFGEGFAQGEEIKLVLNRYRVYNFTQFPFLEGETRYLLSFVPVNYLKDVRLQVWEYNGTNQSISNEDLQTSIQAVGQKVSKAQSTINAAQELLKAIKKKQSL